jgi:predicted transcriptional regulator
MRVKPAFRGRDDTEVAVLDALADRAEDGMTVFELRTHVDADIDTLEDALASLNADGLIDAADDGDRTVIRPDESVLGPDAPPESGGWLAELRRRLPF